jgi:hypothetical protein
MYVSLHLDTTTQQDNPEDTDFRVAEVDLNGEGNSALATRFGVMNLPQ